MTRNVRFTRDLTLSVTQPDGSPGVFRGVLDDAGTIMMPDG